MTQLFNYLTLTCKLATLRNAQDADVITDRQILLGK